MTTAVTHSEFNVASVHSDLFDELVSRQFERVYAIVDTFVGDHQQTVAHTKSVFRMLDGDARVDNRALYQVVGAVVRRLPASTTLPAGMATDDALCLLFKELCGYCYDDIAGLLGLDTQDVKIGISRARHALLAQ